MDDVLDTNEKINTTLYKAYSNNFRKGIAQVYHDSGVEELKANVNRFAAYKAYEVTTKVKADPDKAQSILNQYQAWQAAEYDTTVARARTAKQWGIYTQPDRKRLFPNITWLPSTSAEPRPEHVPFYNRTWAKDDPFWAENTPGSLWNCKCGMQETADDVTDNKDIDTPTPPPGLEGNPGITQEIFTDKASYFDVKDKKEVEQKTYSLSRKVSLSDSLSRLKDKTVIKDTKENKISVMFNKNGLEHIQHNYFPNKWLRDEYLKEMDILLKESEYVTEADDYHDNKMVGKYFYYKIKILGKDWFLNVRQVNNDKCYLYALTDKIKRR